MMVNWRSRTLKTSHSLGTYFLEINMSSFQKIIHVLIHRFFLLRAKMLTKKTYVIKWYFPFLIYRVGSKHSIYRYLLFLRAVAKLKLSLWSAFTVMYHHVNMWRMKRLVNIFITSPYTYWRYFRFNLNITELSKKLNSSKKFSDFILFTHA